MCKLLISGLLLYASFIFEINAVENLNEEKDFICLDYEMKYTRFNSKVTVSISNFKDSEKPSVLIKDCKVDKNHIEYVTMSVPAAAIPYKVKIHSSLTRIYTDKKYYILKVVGVDANNKSWAKSYFFDKNGIYIGVDLSFELGHELKCEYYSISFTQNG